MTFFLTKLLSKMAYSVFGQLLGHRSRKYYAPLMLLHYIVWRYSIVVYIWEACSICWINSFTNELSNLHKIPQCTSANLVCLIMICVIFEQICQNLNWSWFSRFSIHLSRTDNHFCDPNSLLPEMPVKEGGICTVVRLRKIILHCLFNWFKQLYFYNMFKHTVIQCINFKNRLMYSSS